MNIVEENIKRTNIVYGGFNPSVTKVFFTNGLLDPWHVNGITKELNELTPVALLPRTAHVADFGQISDSDTPEMTASKKKVGELIRQWLNLSGSRSDVKVKIESNQNVVIVR